MTSQLGAQFAFSQPRQGVLVTSLNILDTSFRTLVTPPGTLRIGQSLYITIEVGGNAESDQQCWLMPWWLHPTFEYRYPGQNGYTPQDTLLFGPQNPSIEFQDSLWMTSPKRYDIVGAPSPAGTSISDMQSDIWVIDLPAGKVTVKKSFFYPSHGYGLAVTSQIYTEGTPSIMAVNIAVTPGALHSVFQDSQG